MFTRPGVDPLENGAPGLDSVTGAASELVYERRSSVITNPDGSVVFKMEGAEIPAGLVASSRPTSSSPSTSARPASTATRSRARPASARSSTASRTPSARPASSFGGYFATTKDADTFEAELSLPAGPPVRRVQLAGVVQLRPLPRVRHQGLGRQLGLGPEQPTPSSRPRTPTSARSARRASSRRSTTT